eukprot:TRINITY_DN12249_c0_g1_i1.p1 TRINITY_DN12249_c0_g1~~TRINITY_DN12249_c0_g1_i1.p1  ORF type:complete len:402 (+),score=58.91 TRINITY_DN12249_c0_g1_i1:61-1266(+)
MKQVSSIDDFVLMSKELEEPQRSPRARENLHEAIQLMRKLEHVLSDIPDDAKWRAKLRSQWRSVEKKMHNFLYPCDDMEQVESDDDSDSTGSTFSCEDTSEFSSGCSADRDISKTLNARCVCGKMLEEDFINLYHDNKLQTLSTSRLNPFLKVHKLSLTGLKEEKIVRIIDCIRKESLIMQKDPDALSENEDDAESAPSLSPDLVPRLMGLDLKNLKGKDEVKEDQVAPTPVVEVVEEEEEEVKKEQKVASPRPQTPRAAGRRGSATVIPSPSLVRTPRNGNSASPQLRRASQPSLSVIGTRGTPTPRRNSTFLEVSAPPARRTGSFVGSRLSAPLHTPRRNSCNGPPSARRMSNGEIQSPPLKKAASGLLGARTNKPRSATLTPASGASRSSNGRNVAVP